MVKCIVAGDPHPGECGTSDALLGGESMANIKMLNYFLGRFRLAGNVLLLGADEGRPQLGLIDYGQVKFLSKEDRLLFAKLILALADNDKKKIVQLMKEAG